MTVEKPGIAVFTNSAALASIIEMILARDDGLRVVTFTSYKKLAAHMRIAPADVLVCDYEQDGWTAPEMLVHLRRHAPNRLFRSIVLTSYVSHEVRQGCRFAQVDEVIVKPMSPLFLEERVEAHLAALDLIDAQREADSTPATDNVVPLFGRTEASGPVPA